MLCVYYILRNRSKNILIVFFFMITPFFNILEKILSFHIQHIHDVYVYTQYIRTQRISGSIAFQKIMCWKLFIYTVRT